MRISININDAEVPERLRQVFAIVPDELAVAAHLSRAGFDVEFTDIEDRARFDLLAQKEDIRLEVDCKTASGDVGRKIHRRRAIELSAAFNQPF
jgi:uncharacterized UPF0146 family protein